MSDSTTLQARLSAQVGELAIDVELDAGGGPLVLVGPNGAGKTTLFSLLLGVLPSLRARVQVGDVVLHDTDAGIAVPVEQRRLGYVPQDYALFPHLSVRDNVAFAVRSARGAAGAKRGEQDARVDAALGDLGISALAARFPHELSGGERQRLALARALSVRPRALLLDEPLAALDVHSRREVRAFLRETLAQLAIPAIVITHDAADARALGTRIVVVESGKVTQAGSWDMLADRPASRFIKEFVADAGP